VDRAASHRAALAPGRGPLPDRGVIRGTRREDRVAREACKRRRREEDAVGFRRSSMSQRSCRKGSSFRSAPMCAFPKLSFALAVASLTLACTEGRSLPPSASPAVSATPSSSSKPRWSIPDCSPGMRYYMVGCDPKDPACGPSGERPFLCPDD
jgi:hypothetical protein